MFRRYRGPGGVTNALHRAAEAGDQQLVAQILHGSSDWVNKRDEKGRTPLHLACKHGHATVVVMLLVNGGRLDIADAEGMNPFHHAASEGHAELVDLLAESFAALEETEEGENALHMAASGGHEAVVSILLKKTNLAFGVDGCDLTPLHVACREGQFGVVKLLVTRHPELLEKVADRGLTPLHLAACNAREEMAKWMLAKNPKLVFAKNDDGTTVLHRCVTADFHGLSVDFIKQVYEMDPTALRALDGSGQTPFHWAITYDPRLIEPLQWRLGIDEIASCFAHCKKSCAPALPAIEAQCEPLFAAMNRDVIGTIFEYIGLSRARGGSESDNKQDTTTSMTFHMSGFHNDTQNEGGEGEGEGEDEGEEMGDDD